MIYLLLSILFNSLLFIIFKLFTRFKINNLQAIVVNYITAASFGFLTNSSSITITELHQQPWIYGAALLGLLFICIFFTLGLTSQKGGVTIASVSSKMSVIIPVVFAFIVYKEPVSTSKIIGIILALFAVYLVTNKKGANTFDKRYLFLPIILFLGSGVIDTLLKYIETNYVSSVHLSIYSSTIFLTAAILGTLFLGIKSSIKKEKIQLKNIIAGIILGIPNYYSIVMLLKALNTSGMESSIIFPINNVGILTFTAIVGYFFFKEKLSPKNWIGIAVAILAIVLISTNLT